MAYDFRGKQVFRHTDSPYLEVVDTSRTRYDGFGAVVAVDRRKATGSTIEFSDEFDVDALGNVWSSHSNRALQDPTRGQIDSYYNGGLQYNRETNPLAHVRDQGGWGPLITSLNTTESAFDNSGNLIKSHEWLAVYSHTTSQVVDSVTYFSDEFDDHPDVGEAFTRNFYGADEKLRVSQRTMNTAGSPRHVQTEYRYDALGRRVLLRSRTDSTKCGSSPVGPDCLPTIERFYWDGDQLLVEHRGDGGYSETLSTLNALPTTSTWYGRVRYTHAMGIDDPLVVRKAGSTPFVPHRSGRGGFEAGTYWTGASMDAYHWPQRNAGVYLAADARAETLEPLGWFGSLLDGKTDPNGLQYMRNRYYDPASGRFTQRDPIGLAGGMNLYGYADGDPINNSDPFGLCANPTRFFSLSPHRSYNNTGARCRPIALGAATRALVLQALGRVNDLPGCQAAVDLMRTKVAEGKVKTYAAASYRDPQNSERAESADYHRDTGEVHLRQGAMLNEEQLSNALMHEAFHAMTTYNDDTSAQAQGSSNLANKFAQTCLS